MQPAARTDARSRAEIPVGALSPSRPVCSTPSTDDDNYDDDNDDDEAVKSNRP